MSKSNAWFRIKATLETPSKPIEATMCLKNKKYDYKRAARLLKKLIAGAVATQKPATSERYMMLFFKALDEIFHEGAPRKRAVFNFEKMGKPSSELFGMFCELLNTEIKDRRVVDHFFCNRFFGAVGDKHPRVSDSNIKEVLEKCYRATTLQSFDRDASQTLSDVSVSNVDCGSIKIVVGRNRWASSGSCSFNFLYAWAIAKSLEVKAQDLGVSLKDVIKKDGIWSAET